MSDPMDSLLNPYLTFHYDKVSCMRGGYFAHVVFCYLVFLSGIGAFATRVIPSLKWTHSWLGRAYIMSMLWATGTSLIIHNTGLPPATLVSFVWALGGMCVAWVLIKFHELAMDRQALANVQDEIKVNGLGSETLAQKIAAEKGRIAATKTFKQRFFSIKALHGMIMFTSWINIAGRIFASNQTGDFTCYTYPVYKPIVSPEIPVGLQSADASSLSLVPTRDPNYAALPWARLGLAGWSVALSVGPMVGSALVGALFSWFAVRQLARSRTAPQSSTMEAVEIEAAGK